MLAVDDGREGTVQVVAGHEVAAAVLRRRYDERPVLGRVRPGTARVAGVVGDAAMILARQGDGSERADARPLCALVALGPWAPAAPAGPAGPCVPWAPVGPAGPAGPCFPALEKPRRPLGDRKSTRLNPSHRQISYA